ncbi:MAG TPA: S1 RNA-binding domain-containing protein [Candidatus Merdenecus merdavium]|nr:S1 RNA-binding domain-containing protein [Candidatus Merdenecus merdavium]
MKELGRKQELMIIKKVDFGVYLGEFDGDEHRVLLPKKQVPEGASIGDTLEVFLYKDSKDRMIATTREPVFQVGETAMLKVVELGKIGAFLDWGLEKDLLLPFKEQTGFIHVGQEYLVGLYIDKSERLCATMKVYDYLRTDSPYKEGDQVEGIVYEISEEFGVFVAVDHKYSGLIKKQEAQGKYKVGTTIKARVTKVKEDGKLDLSTREKAYLQMDEDAEMILRVMDEFEGVLPFNDKVSPEVIKREFGLSKNAFKRAVGRLLKEGKIEITENRIKKV